MADSELITEEESVESYADNDISILNYSQAPVIYQGVPKIWLTHPDSTDENPKRVPFTYGEIVDGVTIQPDFSSGNMRISVPDGSLVKAATIVQPANLKPENIPQGMYIAGVGPGIYEGGGAELDMVASYGSFTPTAATESITVKHGMGVVPDEIFLVAVNPAQTASGLRWLEGKSIEFARLLGNDDPQKGHTMLGSSLLAISHTLGINENDGVIYQANPFAFYITGTTAVSLIPGCEYVWRAFGGFAKHTDVLYLKLTLSNFGILNVSGGVPAMSQLEIYVDGNYAGVVDYTYAETVAIDISGFGDNLSQHTVTVVPIGDTLAELYPKVYADSVTGWLSEPPIYGVTGLYSAEPALERTDDAVGMTYTINSTGTIDSDFNSVFPWSKSKLVSDANGNQFVQMPGMYFRVGMDEYNRITDIAVSETEHAGGTWYYVMPFCYGRYGGYVSSSKMYSKSGYTRAASYTRAQFRTYASNNGDNYHQLDLYHRTVMNFLWWIEFATKDSMSVMTGRISGSGTSGGSTKLATGRTDSISTPSGFEKTYGQMRFHYIEDFIGNLMEWVDGIYASGTGSTNADYVTDEIGCYTDVPTDMHQTAYGNSGNGCIAAYGWDPKKPFLCTPTESVTNSKFDTYFCDYVCRGSSTPVPYTGAAYNGSTTYNGTAYFYQASTAAYYASIGSRLMYRGELS